MYKATVRAEVRHGLARLNAGGPSFFLKLAAPDLDLAFPGENSWAAMFRPVRKSPRGHVTHEGRDECAAFAQRLAQA